MGESKSRWEMKSVSNSEFDQTLLPSQVQLTVVLIMTRLEGTWNEANVHVENQPALEAGSRAGRGWRSFDSDPKGCPSGTIITTLR
jgi:hypothetical protein